MSLNLRRASTKTERSFQSESRCNGEEELGRNLSSIDCAALSVIDTDTYVRFPRSYKTRALTHRLSLKSMLIPRIVYDKAIFFKRISFPSALAQWSAQSSKKSS